MNATMNNSVRLVAEFMQSKLPTEELVSVAECLNALARPMWGHYPRRSGIVPLSLLHEEVTSLQQLTATESLLVPARADGGSVAAAGD
jgi:hypothetical protein